MGRNDYPKGKLVLKVKDNPENDKLGDTKMALKILTDNKATITDAKVWFDTDVRRGAYRWESPTGRAVKPVSVEDGYVKVGEDYATVDTFIRGTLIAYESAERIEVGD